MHSPKIKNVILQKLLNLIDHRLCHRKAQFLFIVLEFPTQLIKTLLSTIVKFLSIETGKSEPSLTLKSLFCFLLWFSCSADPDQTSGPSCSKLR